MSIGWSLLLSSLSEQDSSLLGDLEVGAAGGRTSNQLLLIPE